MKTKLCVLTILLAATFAQAQTNNLTALLQQGLFEEQANRNLDAAIADYQALARQFDKDRQLAATAIFRLGECYRMQNKTNEAAAEYQRILRDFSDQTTLATLSRQDLTGMGMAPAPLISSSLQTQKELLAKQIALAQQDFADAKGRFQSGTATQSEVNAAESRVLRLQQQLAALDSGRAELLDLSPPASSDEDQEIQRIQTMIQNSPDLINAPVSGVTPLENAASHGWLKVAAFLLEHGADVNARGGLALIDAAQAGNRTMVEFLLAHGADVGTVNALFTAVRNGFEAVTKVLLANKADVNGRDGAGNTPLCMAAQRSQTNIIQMLLTAGAEVNVENNQGRTPLSYAAEGGSPEMVKMLLAAKADPNAGRWDAPLLCAIHNQDLASAELLLQSGANPNVKGSITFNVVNPVTPLWLAVSSKHFSMVQLLLKFKADPNESQTDGLPLLFSALSDTNFLETLLDAGAKVDARDPTAKTGDSRVLNWTPLLLAVENNLPATTVEILLKHGANPNARDGAFGQTPLHWITGWGRSHLPNPKVLELLLDYKAEPNVQDSAGRTPLDELKQWLATGGLAPEQKTVLDECVNLLRQHGALDNLPDWGSIKVSRPSANFSAGVFRKGTNDWNHLTLLETILNFYTDHVNAGQNLSFPDFSRVVILRPNHDSTNVTRLTVNLLNRTNGIDCAKDVPLKFGDVVEIPERDHALGDRPVGLTESQQEAIETGLRGRVEIVAGNRKVEIPIYPVFGSSFLGSVLAEPAAQDILMSSSELSHVKVIRHDPNTGKPQEWTLDCSRFDSSALDANKNCPDLWLRDGDVITVPEKK